MSGLADPGAYAQAWIDAWNRRDVEAVLEHFHEDAVFTSPLAARLGKGDFGVIRGKEELREYWNYALSLIDTLHFELTGLYAGTDTLLIAFRTHDGENRVEVLRFRDGLVIEGHGTYAV